MIEAKRQLARVHAGIAGANYKVELSAGRHRLAADEPASRGGADAGAAPYDLVLSGLAACTAITLRMYAERQGWDLQAADVDARLFKQDDSMHIERELALRGELTPEQRARLLDVSERTPVTLTLKGGVEIRTALR